jgi:hypothetical protein
LVVVLRRNRLIDLMPRAGPRLRDHILLLIVLAICFPGPLGNTSAAQARQQSEKPEVVRWLPLTKFYDTAQPLPAGKPGDLIRSEEADDYPLTPGVNALRILYHSRSANGDDVASSGLILYPDQKPPAGGWPIIAWAHEASDVARQCAPSLSRILPHGPFLTMYVNLGYGVVATDYAGLGTGFPYAFSDMPSNAADVIASIPAARAALPQLAKRWIAIGAESSSRTVIDVAVQEHELRDPTFLGSIAISGLDDLENKYLHADGASPLFLAYGIKAVYPQFEASAILMEKGVTRYQQIRRTCDVPTTGESGLVKPEWRNDKFVKDFFSRNRLAQRRLSAPVLALDSNFDSATAAEATNTVRRLCQQGARVQFQTYDDPNPGNVIGDSVRDQMAWIQGRLAGRPAPSNCPGLH